MQGFEFIKFRPKSELAQNLNTTLIRLVDFIPNGMIVAASIRKTKEKYQCEIVVRTRDTDFIQDNTSYDASLAVERATECLRQQMVEWRAKHMKMSESSFWNFEQLEIEKRENEYQNERRTHGSEKFH